MVNKVDNFDKFMPDVYEFYNLGIGDPHPVSAASRLGIGDMLDAVSEYFPEGSEEEEEDERPRVAIVGKPNVGKSSIINKLVGEERVIVSDIAERPETLLTQRSCTTEESMCLLTLRGFAARIRSKKSWSGTVLSVP